MGSSGKIKIDDLHQSVQDGFTNDKLAISGGGSGFNGIGFNPLGAVKKIDDNDPAITYSVGDWIRTSYPYMREGLNNNLSPFVSTSGKIGASLTIKFTGTALYMYAKQASDQGTLGVVVDGITYSNVDLVAGVSQLLNYGAIFKIVDGLSYGNHTAIITIIGNGSNGVKSSCLIGGFDVLAQPVGKNLIPPSSQGWALHVNYKIASPYKVILIASALDQQTLIDIPVSPNQTYTFSTASNAYIAVNILDVNKGYLSGNSLILASSSITIATTSTTAYLRIHLSNGNSTPTGTFTFDNLMLNIGATALPFETNGYDKIALAIDSQWNKSSAFVGGSRVDAITNLTQSVNEITNLIPNASFERISPTWSTVFYDDFNRVNGAVGGGWSGGTISANQLSLPASSGANNGDFSWTDRQVKFSFVMPSSLIYVYTKMKDAGNWVRTLIQGGSISYQTDINNVFTAGLSSVGGTFTTGTTYYVTAKAQGNIYTFTITSNADYVTGAIISTIYLDSINTGSIYLETGVNAAVTLFDNVVVTAPFPDAWVSSSPATNRQQVTSFSGGIAKLTNSLILSGGTNEVYLTTANFQIIPNTTYTMSFDAYGSDVNLSLDCFLLSSTGTVVQGSISQTITTIWTTYKVTFTTTSDITGINQYIRFDNNGSTVVNGALYIRNLMLVTGSTAPTWHTKESRCDLICLQNDGQVITTQGTGTSELGYRVEAEDGSISSFWRDKRTVQHWDRAKVWKSGTWSLEADTYSNNKAHLYSVTLNDTFYISFVGTGIDLLYGLTTAAGIIGVSIDGGTEVLYDEYAPVFNVNSRISLARNLPYGQHTIKLRVTATKNTLAVGAYIYIDSFDIYVPAIPMCPSPNTLLPVSAVIKADPDYGWIRYEENEGVMYSGTWNTYSNQTDSGGADSYNAGTSTTDYAEFSFIGTGIRLITDKTVQRGIITPSFDGLNDSNIDLYNATVIAQYIGYTKTCSFGLHKMRITTTNTKNVSANNYLFSLDAFDIKNTMYVIDLRKNQSQTLIEQKIAEHEAKDLWDAHSWAVKGNVQRVRIETGAGTAVNIPATTVGTVAIAFSKTFTVTPKVFITAEAGNPQLHGQVSVSSLTTSGFNLNWYNGATSTITLILDWTAIGY